MNKYLTVPFLLLFLTSCTVQSPKYTTLDKVISLQVGMTKTQVEEILVIQQYKIQSRTNSTNV